jgi:hypothetical protein
MGLFSRKSSKPQVAPSEQSAASNGSLQSPAALPNSSDGRSSMKPSPPVHDVPLPKAPDPALDPAAYLRSIYAVRERTRLVLEKAKKNQLKHFTVDMTKFQETAGYVVSIIKVSLKLPFNLNPLTITTARLCSRLCLHPSPRPLAALRGRWPAPHRPANGVLALDRRQPGADASFD